MANQCVRGGEFLHWCNLWQANRGFRVQSYGIVRFGSEC